MKNQDYLQELNRAKSYVRTMKRFGVDIDLELVLKLDEQTYIELACEAKKEWEKKRCKT